MFTYDELLKSIKEEMTPNDIKELKKTIIAYDLDVQDKEVVENLYNYYFESKEEIYFINHEIAEYYDYIRYMKNR